MKLLKKIWKKWRALAFKIGTFQARVILTVFYFTILLPFSLGVTLFSQKMVKRKPKTTLWRQWTEKSDSLEEARRQF